MANFLTSEVQRKLFTTYLLIHFGLFTVITKIMKLYDKVHKGVNFLKLFYVVFMVVLLLNYIVSKIDEYVWSTGAMILTRILKY